MRALISMTIAMHGRETEVGTIVNRICPTSLICTVLNTIHPCNNTQSAYLQFLEYLAQCVVVSILVDTHAHLMLTLLFW